MRVLSSWVPVACVVALAASPVFGNGYRVLCVKSTKATAMGEAFTVGADDASAIAFNPAALSRLRGYQIREEGTLCNGYTERTSPTTGEETDIEDRWQLVPSFFASADFGLEDVGFGLGVTLPNGLSSEWAKDSFARYAATYSNLTVMDIAAGIGVRVWDRLRLGATLDFYYSEVELQRMVNPVFLGYPAGTPDLKNTLQGDGTAWGFTLGAIFDITPRHRVGLTYRSPFVIDYDGDFSLTGMPDGDFAGTIEFPAVITAGNLMVAERSPSGIPARAKVPS